VKNCIAYVTALLALGIASATAEEMATPPSQFITRPVPYLTWSGFYAGINGGYAWGNSSFNYTPNDPAALAGTCGGTGGGKCIPTGDFRRAGALAGGQLGYNWQISTLWLTGIEADYQWSNSNGTGYSLFHLGDVGAPALSNLTTTQSLQSFGTVRVRMGVLIINSLLLYGTGGLAFGQVDENLKLSPAATGGLTSTSGTFSYFCTAGTTCFAGSSSKTLWGWSAGAGAEYAITTNLTFKTELLYVHLEASSTTATATALNTVGTTAASFAANFSPVYFAVMRGGLNYRF
jgi:outer membrane immunogenic protein